MNGDELIFFVEEGNFIRAISDAIYPIRGLSGIGTKNLEIIVGLMLVFRQMPYF
jgi:hypothetical protein